MLIASRTGRDGSLTIHRDVDLYAALVGQDESISHQLETGRSAWIQIARGSVKLNERELRAGDGAAVTEAGALAIVGEADAEVLLFDIAGYPRRLAET